MSTTADEWIGVAEVAAEMKLTERRAWELIRRLCVPRIEGARSDMAGARFRRSDWEKCRDGAVKPPEPRARAGRLAPAPPPARPAARPIPGRANKMREA